MLDGLRHVSNSSDLKPKSGVRTRKLKEIVPSDTIDHLKGLGASRQSGRAEG